MITLLIIVGFSFMPMNWGRGKRGQLGTPEALHPKFDVEEGKKDSNLACSCYRRTSQRPLVII